MSEPFNPQMVTQRWVNSLLRANATVTTIVGNAIYPNVSATDIKTRHLTHTFGGPGSAIGTQPMRAPIALVSLLWDITAWEPGYSQQALEPLMVAVMTELIGTDTRGRVRRFIDGSRSFTMHCDYVGPEYVPVEVAPAGIWAPLRDRYAIAVQPT